MSQSSSCLTSAEYIALAEKLQNVAQSLLSLSTAQTPDIFSDVPSNTSLLDILSELPPQVPVSRDAKDVHSVDTGEVHSVDIGEVYSFDISSGDIHSIDGSEVCSVDADEARSIGASEVRSVQKTNISSKLPPKVPVPMGASGIHSVDAGEVRSFDMGSGEVHSVNSDEVCSADKIKARSVSAGEVRSFFFSAPAIQLERELLQKHRTESFQGLLKEVHALLIGLVKLMQSVHKDARFRGHIIISLGMQLSHVSSLVLRMCTIYDKVVLLQKEGK